VGWGGMGWGGEGGGERERERDFFVPTGKTDLPRARLGLFAGAANKDVYHCHVARRPHIVLDYYGL